MGTTANYALRYPELIDPPNVQQDIKNLASDADAKLPAVPIGSTLEWDYAGAAIPTWALLPYGQAISRTTYAALNSLASAAGYLHGSGDGSTTFNVADKRGRFSAGKDDMGGTAASRITAAISGTAGTVLGAAVGNEGVTLATAQIPSHSHTGGVGTGVANLATESADHGHHTDFGGVSANHYHLEHANTTYPSNPGGLFYVERLTGYSGHGTGTTTLPNTTNWINQNHTHSGNSGGRNTAHTHGDNGHSHTINATGGGGSHLNMQPTIIVNKFLRVL